MKATQSKREIRQSKGIVSKRALKAVKKVQRQARKLRKMALKDSKAAVKDGSTTNLLQFAAGVGEACGLLLSEQKRLRAMEADKK